MLVCVLPATNAYDANSAYNVYSHMMSLKGHFITVTSEQSGPLLADISISQDIGWVSIRNCVLDNDYILGFLSFSKDHCSLHPSWLLSA